MTKISSIYLPNGELPLTLSNQSQDKVKIKELYIQTAILLILVGSSLRLYGCCNLISLYSDEVDIGYQVISFLSTGSDYQDIPPFTVSFFRRRPHFASDILDGTILLIPGISLELAIRLTPAIFHTWNCYDIH
jgi:hypothetical protein